ncbi:hypothetical protein MAR_006376 [Mya arenaria]|uniref:Uncharacterized protein n=1 Tax=Mya arenaria TaxID=6604 RepID=A0ABY7DFW4_MYAAR|nr:hypothetical protein MAR_006376 [Mya arenaria]
MPLAAICQLLLLKQNRPRVISSALQSQGKSIYNDATSPRPPLLRAKWNETRSKSGCLIWLTKTCYPFNMVETMIKGTLCLTKWMAITNIMGKIVFHGCFWLGCPQCFSETTISPVRDMSMVDLYARTLEKKEFIEDNNYSYRSNLECEF